MEKRNLWIIALVAIITVGIITCGGNDDTPTPKTFTVTFDADNGSPIETQTVNEGNKAVKPITDPIKNGFSFVYWFNVATNNEWDYNTAITANINLKAKWLQRDFTIAIEGKDFTIAVKDTRTRINDTNLKELGIIDAITTKLKDAKEHPKFDEVFGRNGFTIFIEVTDEYDYYKTYNQTKVGISFEFVNNPGVLLPTAIGMIINAMVDGATYPQQI